MTYYFKGILKIFLSTLLYYYLDKITPEYINSDLVTVRIFNPSKTKTVHPFSSISTLSIKQYRKYIPALILKY